MQTAKDKLIYQLNKYTNGKKDITHIGLFLAKEPNDSPLKLLNYFLTSIQRQELEKTIEINRWKPKYRLQNGVSISEKENIPSRLIENQRVLAQILLDDLAKSHQIDFDFKPYKYNLKELMAKKAVEKESVEESAIWNLQTLLCLLETRQIVINSTMNYSLKQILQSDRSEELKALARQILEFEKESLVLQKNSITRNNYSLKAEDYEYFHDIIIPRLKRKEFKLK